MKKLAKFQKFPNLYRMGVCVPSELGNHLSVRCFALPPYASLCAYAMLCYAESNDHWSLRVCPIPNLNLIPVVRLPAARRW